MSRKLDSAVSLAVLALCLGGFGCKESTGPHGPSALTAVSGNGQSGTVAQALPNPLVVKVTDADGVGMPGVNVVWAVTAGGGALSVSASITDVTGSAVCVLTLGAVAGANTVTATVAGLPSIPAATFTATGTAGAAARLAFTVQPGSVMVGATISPAVQVAVQDTLGNTVAGSTDSITIFITSGTGTAGAVLGGTRKVAAVSGVATFGTLTVDSVGTGYTLTATATGLASTTSATFAVRQWALAFTVQPGSVIAGATISPAVQVTVRDTLGNTVTASTDSITVAITSGTGTEGAVLGGTRKVAAVSGVATFGTLTVDKAGTGYTLTATAPSRTSATSAAFAVTPGAAAKLGFTVQPRNVVAGETMSPAVRVAVQDALGNTVTGSTATIALAITSGTGTTGAVLGGASTLAAVAGVATFGDLAIDSEGAGYTLSATSSGLSGTTSGSFNVATGLTAPTRESVVLGGTPFAVAVSASGVVYVSRLSDGTIVRADLPSASFTATIPAGLLPSQVRISPDGQTAYVGNQDAGTVTFVNVSTGQPFDTVAVLGSVLTIGVSPDGLRVYALTDYYGVYVIDAVARAVIGSIPASSTGTILTGVAFHPSAPRMYVCAREAGTVTVIDTDVDTVVTTYSVSGGRIQNAAVATDGSELYATDIERSSLVIWNLASGSSVYQEILLGSGVSRNAFDVAVTPDNGQLYVSTLTDGKVYVLNRALRVVIGSIGTGGSPRHIAFSADGTVAVIPNELGWVDFIRR